MAAAAPVLAPRLPSVALMPLTASPVDDVPVVDFLLSMILEGEDTQVREGGLDEKAVQRYLDALQADPPEELPPVDLRKEPGALKAFLGDGFHRTKAYRLAGRLVIKARVRPGGREDAILDGIRGNRKHGLPMAENDRKKAVMMLLCGAKFAAGELPQAEIARRVGISPSVVSDMAKDLTLQGRIVPPDTRTTKGGRKISTAKIGRTRAAAPSLVKERPAAPAEGAADDQEAARPLTPGMKQMLTRLEEEEPRWSDLSQGEQNQVRALERRGLADYDLGRGGTCRATPPAAPAAATAEPKEGYRSLLGGEEGEALEGKPKLQGQSPSLTKLQALEAQVRHLGESGDPAWRRRVAQVMRQAAEQLQPLQGTDAEPVSRTPLWRALHGFDGAEKRWAKLRRSGATDDALREAISKEFGGQGSTTGPGLCEVHRGGAAPSVRLGRDPKVELSGAALLGAVRGLLLIPKLQATTIQAARRAAPAQEPRREPATLTTGDLPVVPGMRWEKQGGLWHAVPIVREQMTLQEAFAVGDAIVTGYGSCYRVAGVGGRSGLRVLDARWGRPKDERRINDLIVLGPGVAREVSPGVKDPTIPIAVPITDRFVVRVEEEALAQILAKGLEAWGNDWGNQLSALKELARAALTAAMGGQ